MQCFFHYLLSVSPILFSSFAIPSYLSFFFPIPTPFHFHFQHFLSFIYVLKLILILFLPLIFFPLIWSKFVMTRTSCYVRNLFSLSFSDFPISFPAFPILFLSILFLSPSHFFFIFLP